MTVHAWPKPTPAAPEPPRRIKTISAKRAAAHPELVKAGRTIASRPHDTERRKNPVQTSLSRKGAIPKKKRPIGRNAIRKIREFQRCFGSKERVEFIKRLQCVATGQFGNTADPIDNAHVCDDGTKGMGRRSGYACIVPLKRSAHRLLHRNPSKFYATYGAFNWPAMAAYTNAQWEKFVGATGAGRKGLS